MSNIIGQNRVVVWFQPEGPGTQFRPLGIGEKAAGMSGKSIPGPGRTPVYGRNEFGRPMLIKMNSEAPGDLPTATITIYERAQMDFIRESLNRGCPINIQTRIVRCGALNNPNNWDVIDHWANGEITQIDPGDAPGMEFNGEAVMTEGQISFTHSIRLVQTQLSALTIATAEDLLSITGITDEDCGECGNGYPGADRIMYIGASAAAAATADVFYTVNGGGVWATTSADPFAADEDVNFLAIRFLNQTQLRLVAGTGTTDALAKAKLAYATLTLGSEGTTVWTTVTLAGTVNGDVIQSLFWPNFERLYAASAGDIYLSLDQGETFTATAIYSGVPALNGFAKSPDDNIVYTFGATNAILREVNQSGVFEARVGPSGGGAFTAAAVASDGRLYAGNGTSIYVSTDGANSAGNWTALRNFGADTAVKSIQVIGGSRALGGDPQLIRVIVDSTVGSSGTVWMSVDGGATWLQTTTVTNTGYNGAYWSDINDNRGVVPGDGGLIHRIAEKA